jgi:N-acetylmuramoyl-L-alanine amidase
MIIKDHKLVGVKSQPLSGGKPMLIRRAVVIHFTSGATAQSSINFWKEPKSRSIDLGAHIIIDRDGTIIQCRPFNKTISHAGVSKWIDPNTNRKFTGCNQFTIGIELANAGNDDRVIRIASQLTGYAGVITAKHRNGGPMDTWEDYSDPQYLSCLNVVKTVVKQYNLDDITGHDCIAPSRKNDPGPAFPMAKLRAECGFTGLPVVHY